MCERINPAIKALGAKPLPFKWRIKEFFSMWRSRRKDKNGVAPIEVWNLYSEIAHYVYPRLKSYREYDLWGHPWFIYDKDGNQIVLVNRDDAQEVWVEEVKKMEGAFKRIIQNEYSDKLMTTEEWDKVEEGLLSFARNFRNLWD